MNVSIFQKEQQSTSNTLFNLEYKTTMNPGKALEKWLIMVELACKTIFAFSSIYLISISTLISLKLPRFIANISSHILSH